MRVCVRLYIYSCSIVSGAGRKSVTLAKQHLLNVTVLFHRITLAKQNLRWSVILVLVCCVSVIQFAAVPLISFTLICVTVTEHPH